MRFGILKNYEQTLARSAAILLVGGLAAGCSSQVDRFGESILTGSSYPQRQRTASLAEQPYPGDIGYGNLDRTATGSVGDRVVRPDAPVGGGGMTTGNTGSAPAWQQPSTAAPVSGVQRGSISSAPLAPVTTSNTPAQSRLAPVSGTTQPASAANSNDAGLAAGQTSNGTATKITVRPGETVYNLSKRFGVPESAIVAANGLSSASALQAGQTIVIPSYAYSKTAPAAEPDVEPRAADASAPGTPGQAPAEQKQQRIAVLPRAERLKEDKSAAATDADRSGEQITGSVYTVSAGDTLYGISRKTGVSVADLKAANGLSNGYIQIGQQLKLSASAGTSVAKSAPVDEVKTATVEKPKQEEAKEERVASYTPPKKSDDSSESAESKAGDEQKVAALPPDSTGIGRLRWPVQGRIVSSFGSVGAAGDGIDIVVPEGTPVKAAENGVVIYAGDGLKEFGKTVLVRHEDGLVTVYGYTSDIKVKRGDTVKRGQVIALSGMTGSADRPKLHFEVRKDAAPVDPTKYLD